MTRHDKLNPQELETVSAYIDGELEPQQKAIFEEKLARSVLLQQSLKEQRQLSNALQALPMHPAPHDFTLTAAEAREARRGRFLIPAFSWASVAALAVLAVLLVSDFIFKNYSFAVPSQTVMMEQVPTEAAADQVAAQPQNAPLLNWGPSIAYGVGGAGGSGILGKGGGGPGFDPYLPVPQATPAPQAEIQGFTTEMESTPIIFGLREEALGQQIAQEPAQTPTPSAAQAAPETEQPALVSTNLKLILAGLGIIFGLAALALRRWR